MTSMKPGPVVLDIEGRRLSAQDRERLLHPLVGMVILFSRNYESPQQLLELTQEIHALRSPLLIAVDHEGGRVQRFRQGFSAIPPMAALGRLWQQDVLQSCRAAISAGYVMAAELRAHGVDLTFAPVLDLDWGRSGVIGDRAFHADARCVTMLANHLCHGMALAGMSNCGKHFPGHGWAEADSHHAIPTDERTLAALLETDAAPYAMGASLASVMPAHVVYPQVDAMPAGFSRRWIQDILRKQLGFTGAIFSDDLTMEGARVAGSVTEGAQAALDAGCDFILVCNNSAAADEVLNHVQWRSTPEFEERYARLVPLGDAPQMQQLQGEMRYRAALADVESLINSSLGH